VTHIFGYVASAVLFATLVVQIHKQWKRGTTKGVSRWLFIGQLVASIGFTVESAVIGSTIFVVVNAVLALSAVVGISLWFYQRRRERGVREEDGPLEGGLTSEVRA
jgi:MtN3 and saliva related transmembrane protein